MPFTVALAVSMAVGAYLYQHTQTVEAAQNSLAQMMGVSDLPGAQAPGFALTDQRGRLIALSSFRGRAVLLAFMDSRCTEVCPVLAAEFRLAEQDLASNASRIAFVGVNVNPMAESVTDVERFTRIHGLSGMTNWFFLTGSTSALRAVWKTYGIEVIVPKNATQTVHADYLFFIDPSGKIRYLASPQVDRRKNGIGYLPQGQLARWGRGIAAYLEKALTR